MWLAQKAQVCQWTVLIFSTNSMHFFWCVFFFIHSIEISFLFNASMMIYLQLKSSLVWLHGEMVILDILLDWFHIIMPFQMKNDIGALFGKESCRMVIDISINYRSIVEKDHQIFALIFRVECYQFRFFNSLNHFSWCRRNTKRCWI